MKTDQIQNQGHEKAADHEGLASGFDAKGGKSMMPPDFSLDASTLDSLSSDPHNEVVESLRKAGLCQSEIEMLDDADLAHLSEVAQKWPGKEVVHVYRILARHRMEHGLDPVMNSMQGDGDWVTDPKAKSLGRIRECRYRNSEGEDLQGYMELVAENTDPGIRAIVPYGEAPGAFGGDVILNKSKTTTTLGRFIDIKAAGGDQEKAMNAEVGTNYMRFQPNFKVGKNTGGGNVLSIKDWSLEKNVAWLQSAIDRGDVIQFISDPRAIENVFKEGNWKKGITITGIELGILLMNGLAPREEDGMVVPIGAEVGEMPMFWEEVLPMVEEKLNTMNEGNLKESEERFGSKSEPTDKTPATNIDKAGNLIARQSNFFQ